MKYKLGNKEFKNQTDIKKHVWVVLGRTAVGGSPQGEDGAFVLDLFWRHPRAKDKARGGVKRIFVGTNAHGQKCFWVEGKDGRKNDFSFVKCIQSRSEAQIVRRLFRELVRDQTDAFREKTFGSLWQLRCPVSGQLITRETSHVDHVPPDTFDELVDRFILERGLDLDNIELTKTLGNAQRSIADKNTERAWIRFHQKTAVLRVVSVEANCSIIRKQWSEEKRHNNG